MRSSFLFFFLLLPLLASAQGPLRLGVVGLVHGHVGWILNREPQEDLEIVGIVEADRQLAEQFSQRYGFDLALVYPSLEALVAAKEIEAVATFTHTQGHLAVVEFCAPRGIHVMVEKPLAVSWAHARRMGELARTHGIHLLTNYETTWYPSNWEAYHLIHEADTLGPLRRLVFQTGHQGPVEIGCGPEFLAWLLDPALNGGGALPDFGCYGANLATWLFLGQPPLTVSCVTQQIKPELYPNVEDEATILLTYPEAQVLIQASWNWPYGRKDMEVYGKSGFLICENARDMRLRPTGSKEARAFQAGRPAAGGHDPFHYLAQVVRGQHEPQPFEPSALPNNLLVVQILEAARYAASSGTTVVWKDFFGE
jgi:predicted dehydrogenase